MAHFDIISNLIHSSSVASIVPQENGDPGLHTASHLGLYEGVVRLLGNGDDINSLASLGELLFTPLQLQGRRPLLSF